MSLLPWKRPDRGRLFEVECSCGEIFKVPFDPERGGPVVRVRGFSLMGSVNVQRKGPPGPPVLKRLGWAGH